MQKNLIFHGSHIQDLKKINADTGRFGEKIFGTYTFNKALSYCLNRNAGGTGIIGINSRSYVLDFSIKNAIQENFGSIYFLDANGFKFDDHKGEQEKWVFSIDEPMEVLYELKLRNVISYWEENSIIGVSSEDSIKLLNDFEKHIIDNDFVGYVRNKFHEEVIKTL